MAVSQAPTARKWGCILVRDMSRTATLGTRLMQRTPETNGGELRERGIACVVVVSSHRTLRAARLTVNPGVHLLNVRDGDARPAFQRRATFSGPTSVHSISANRASSRPAFILTWRCRSLRVSCQRQRRMEGDRIASPTHLVRGPSARASRAKSATETHRARTKACISSDVRSWRAHRPCGIYTHLY